MRRRHTPRPSNSARGRGRHRWRYPPDSGPWPFPQRPCRSAHCRCADCPSCRHRHRWRSARSRWSGEAALVIVPTSLPFRVTVNAGVLYLQHDVVVRPGHRLRDTGDGGPDRPASRPSSGIGVAARGRRPRRRPRARRGCPADWTWRWKLKTSSALKSQETLVSPDNGSGDARSVPGRGPPYRR